LLARAAKGLQGINSNSAVQALSTLPPEQQPGTENPENWGFPYYLGTPKSSIMDDPKSGFMDWFMDDHPSFSWDFP
jgi:hypothetical protein